MDMQGPPGSWKPLQNGGEGGGLGDGEAARRSLHVPATPFVVGIALSHLWRHDGSAAVPANVLHRPPGRFMSVTLVPPPFTEQSQTSSVACISPTEVAFTFRTRPVGFGATERVAATMKDSMAFRVGGPNLVDEADERPMRGR